MKQIIFNIILLSSCLSAYSQTQEQKDSVKKVELNEFVVSGNKFEERKKNVTQRIEVVSSQEMAKMNAQTTADVLTNTGQVFVQKSQQGGGSPVIRGFEAARIQLNVDGIRMNNAIYRTGHLQNIVTRDNNSLERLEVLYGPASTIHGSDALGGVILLKTRDPKHGKTKKMELTGTNALLRYSTINQEKTANVGVTFGNKNFASLTNLTFSNFGDMVQGKNGVDSIMDLWKKKFVVERISGVDTLVPNSDPFKQVSSGYSQFDLLQKFSIRSSQKIRHMINFQLSNSTDVPRYDRLTEQSNGVPRSAQWYYGPQFRTLAAYEFNARNLNGFFNDVTATISHQFVEESRHNRNYKSANLNHRVERIHVSGFNVAVRHKDDINEISIGTDAQFNSLKSVAEKENINTGEVSKLDTRYPDGKNNMNLFGLYYQHILKLMDGKLVMNDGIRFNYTSLHSTIIDTSILFRLPFTDLSQRNRALTGNIGLAYMPDDEIRFNINFSSGFRSPNFDDMTKVFESVSGQRLIVPNTDLKPEETRNVDLGIRYNDGIVDLNVYGFYTHFVNAIVSDVYTFNGSDSILYDGVLTPVFASQNKARAFVYGGGFQFIYRPTMRLSLNASMNYTYGRFNNDTILVPLDHVPPVIGRFGIKYEEDHFYGEIFSIFNGRKKLQDYNPGGEDNLQYATPQGMPAWYTINFRAGFTLAKYVQLQAGVENILDRNYRHFASGFSAPGRNFVLAVRFRY
jgi:hemoglobin/transferrin/lactoferrin receptor protein